MHQKVQKEEEGGSYRSAWGCWLCTLSGWSRVAWSSGREPRQPSCTANKAARLTSTALCLFCPLWDPPGKHWHATAWPCAQVLRRGSWARSLSYWLCPPGPVALCRIGLAPQPLLPAKIPRMLLGYRSLQRACKLSVHAAAACDGAETWKSPSRDLPSCFQVPSSFIEIKDVGKN